MQAHPTNQRQTPESAGQCRFYKLQATSHGLVAHRGQTSILAA